ncbi:MAG: hypothetical protein AB6733_14525 [Clostridiaceae bacterium]
MIHLYCDERGTGKTKAMIEQANNCAESALGKVVYIDDDNNLRFVLNSKIRLVSTEEFCVEGYDMLIGLVYGMISNDYDIEDIFIDGLSNITKEDLVGSNEFFLYLEDLVERNNLNIYINVNTDNKLIPEFLKKYSPCLI